MLVSSYVLKVCVCVCVSQGIIIFIVISINVVRLGHVK